MKRVLAVIVALMASGVVSAIAKYQNQSQIPTCWLLESLHPMPKSDKNGKCDKDGFPIPFGTLYCMGSEPCKEFVRKGQPTKYSTRCARWWGLF